MEPEPADKRRQRGVLRSDQDSVSAVSVQSDHSKGDPPLFGPEPGPGPQSGFSAVSVQSDHSKGDPPLFGPGPQPGSGSEYGFSVMSVQSDHSKGDPPLFGPGPRPGPESGFSAESVHSDHSKEDPPLFGPGPRPGPQSGFSAVSTQSDHSKEDPPLFGPGPRPGPQSGFNAVSIKSDHSKGDPPLFGPEPGPGSQVQGLVNVSAQTPLDIIFTHLEEKMLTFVKQELQNYHRLLASELPQMVPESASEGEEQSRDAVLNLTLDFLRRMGHESLAERLSKGSVGVCRDGLKSHLKHRFSQVFEGVAKAGSPAPLQQIYTELYITEGGASEVNQEHEVRHIERVSRKPAERAITCEEMFNQRPESGEPIRAVLTKGVAGVGKTVLTQKFSLDWAEGRANQDIALLFPFTFRELNVLRDQEFSLVGLLHHCFSQTKGLCSFQQLQVLFIFDGLDECRLPLDFSRTRVLTDPTESASVEVLLVNLIRGCLLRSARLWITTRPAAANQIPAESISMVTEVRGFTDPQKEQYFRKRFTDEQQATTVISHMKSVRSLHIMSYIPIFCWILSNVLLHLMKTRAREELPKTLTQMYIHLLVVQAKVKNIKYHEGSGADLHWTPETREMVRSLGKLAFDQLQKGNLIFYESDLSPCGLDAAEIARCSGVFTQVFREEPGLYEDKVYCFIHLSVQEFLAALHVHQTFFSSGDILLSPPHSTESPEPEPSTVEAFYCSAVDQALQSPNGHLDLFLRFLLGLSLPTNQTLLQGLLTQQGSDQTNQETIKYIHEKLNKEGVSAERSLNLLHCLNELNDRSLVQEIQKVMKEGRLSGLNSPAQWSALSFLLLSSDSDLEEFDLRKYHPSEEALLGLLPVVKASTKATLSGCGLSSLSCGSLASVLSSSNLTHLDLSHNPLKDSGVELLCEGLRSAPCRLDTLRLSGCLISESGVASLAAVLRSTPVRLRELDLSYNHPGPSTELLTALQAPDGPLQSLRLDPAGERWMVPGLRKYACEFSLDPNSVHINLVLSEDCRSATRVEEDQPYPHHEDRFDWEQVLSATGLRGRCYWEVEWRGRKWVCVGVSYRGVVRIGGECRFGHNDKSWGLWINDGECYALFNNGITAVGRVGGRSGDVPSGRVSVFLDWEGGALTFSEVLSDGELRHLHTFVTSFTEPLFPGFRLETPGSTVSLVTL